MMTQAQRETAAGTVVAGRPRRHGALWAGTLAVLACLALAACGGDPASEQNTSSGGRGGGDQRTGDFPVTIEHKYGSTEITEAPERVVTVGLTDHDTVLALGVAPVAVREWFGGHRFATWPWAQDELGDAEPTVIPPGELDMEQIAGLRPDLILAVNSGLSSKEYDVLSQIAPTVAQDGEFVDYGTPWQEQARIIGRALGRLEPAEKLVAEVDARFAEARRKHPEFQGAVAAMGLTGPDGNYYAYQSQDARGRFLTSLGFTVPEKLDELAGDAFYATISSEQFGLVGRGDALVWIVNSPQEEAALREDPLYRKLDAPKEGRDIFLPTNEPIAGALSYNTVLSLPYAIDELTPKLEAAVDGDPSTKSS